MYNKTLWIKYNNIHNKNVNLNFLSKDGNHNHSFVDDILTQHKKLHSVVAVSHHEHYYDSIL